MGNYGFWTLIFTVTVIVAVSLTSVYSEEPDDGAPASANSKPLVSKIRKKRQFGALAVAGKFGKDVMLALKKTNEGLGELMKAGEHSDATIAPEATNTQGITALIRGGMDLAEIFGVGPTVHVIILDNRCTTCDLEIRCTNTSIWGKARAKFAENPDEGGEAEHEEEVSEAKEAVTHFKEAPWKPLPPAASYVIKFVTHLPGWDYGIGNFGLVFWACEIKDKNRREKDKNGLDTNQVRIIHQEIFGGEAPREEMNLYEIRNRGLYRMDYETGRIDARQGVIFW